MFVKINLEKKRKEKEKRKSLIQDERKTKGTKMQMKK